MDVDVEERRRTRRRRRWMMDVGVKVATFREK